MNKLSLFIYLTQVIDNLVGLLIFTLCIGGFVGSVGLMAFFTAGLDNGWDRKAAARLAKRYFGTLAVMVVLAVIVPNRQTMLLIAGSELGERAMKSDTVTQIVNPGMDLLKAWIKSETDKISTKTSR